MERRSAGIEADIGSARRAVRDSQRRGNRSRAACQGGAGVGEDQLEREFVEIGFLALLAIILVYLMLGQASGSFVTGVADNLAKFVAAITAPG